MIHDSAVRLLDAIDAKASLARSACPGLWRPDPVASGYVVSVDRRPDGADLVTLVVCGQGVDRQPDMEFIADNDPGSVLRHCAAHKRIVAASQDREEDFGLRLAVRLLSAGYGLDLSGC